MQESPVHCPLGTALSANRLPYVPARVPKAEPVASIVPAGSGSVPGMHYPGNAARRAPVVNVASSPDPQQDPTLSPASGAADQRFVELLRDLCPPKLSFHCLF